MPKYSITGIDKKYLVLEMTDGKIFQLPLAGSMKVKELRKLVHIGKLTEEEQFELQIDFFGKYMGEDYVGEMTQDELNETFKIWVQASNGTLKEDSDRTLGESSASQDS